MQRDEHLGDLLDQADPEPTGCVRAVEEVGHEHAGKDRSDAAADHEGDEQHVRRHGSTDPGPVGEPHGERQRTGHGAGEDRRGDDAPVPGELGDEQREGREPAQEPCGHHPSRQRGSTPIARWRRSTTTSGTSVRERGLRCSGGARLDSRRSCSSPPWLSQRAAVKAGSNPRGCRQGDDLPRHEQLGQPLHTEQCRQGRDRQRARRPSQRHHPALRLPRQQRCVTAVSGQELDRRRTGDPRQRLHARHLDVGADDHDGD